MHHSYFYTTAILTSFSSYTGGVKIAPVQLNVRYLSCYWQEFCLVARILPALKTSLLVSALFLLLCDCVLRASFGARQDTDPILSADIIFWDPSEPRIDLFWGLFLVTNGDNSPFTSFYGLWVPRVYGDLYPTTKAKSHELVVLIWAASWRNWLSWRLT